MLDFSLNDTEDIRTWKPGKLSEEDALQNTLDDITYDTIVITQRHLLDEKTRVQLENEHDKKKLLQLLHRALRAETPHKKTKQQAIENINNSKGNTLQPIGKDWLSLWKTIDSMNISQLYTLTHLVYNAKTFEERTDIFSALLARGMFKRQERKNNIHKLIRNLALFGVLCTLACIPQAKTTKQKMTLFMGATGMTTLAFSADEMKRKGQKRLNQTQQRVFKNPKLEHRCVQISQILSE